MSKKKGIVISPPFEPIYTGGIRCGMPINPIDLRKYLMYWDEIDYPSNPLIEIGSEDIDYLITTGHVKRTRVMFQGRVNSGRGEFFVAAQEAAFRKNNTDEPGCWTIAQLANIPFYTDYAEVTGVELELYDMLPVPSANTPLDDILNFKDKRKDELIAFRCYLDEINEAIISAKDIPRAKNMQLAKLELALKDIDKTIRESGMKRLTTNLKHVIHSDFSGVIFSGAISAAGIHSLIGMSPLIAGVAGAGLITAIKTIMAPKAQCPSNFNYINSIRNNFK